MEHFAHHSESAKSEGNFYEKPEDPHALRELDLLTVTRFFSFFFFLLHNEQAVVAWTYIHALQVFIIMAAITHAPRWEVV